MAEMSKLLDALKENIEQMKAVQSAIWGIESTINGLSMAINNLQASQPDIYSMNQKIDSIEAVLNSVDLYKLLKDIELIVSVHPVITYHKL